MKIYESLQNLVKRIAEEWKIGKKLRDCLSAI